MRGGASLLMCGVVLAAGSPAVAAEPPKPKPPTAEQVLQTLLTKGRAPKTGYARIQFGRAWMDDVTVDGGHNGCDTRNDVLRRDMAKAVTRDSSNGCVVTSGSLADPYTSTNLAFKRGAASSKVQIDHVVALSNAWQTGAQQLAPARRRDLANDPLNLIATTGSVNQSKSDGDAATWLPPAKGFRCQYVARQVAVKKRYGLWVTAAERAAITSILKTCPGQSLPTTTSTQVPLPFVGLAPLPRWPAAPL